jgi:hypothetical protein
MGHGGAGRLFAVAQRGVEDQDAGLRAFVGHGFVPCAVCCFSCRALFTSERSRPWARSEAAKEKQATGGRGRRAHPSAKRYAGSRVMGRDDTQELPQRKAENAGLKRVFGGPSAGRKGGRACGHWSSGHRAGSGRRWPAALAARGVAVTGLSRSRDGLDVTDEASVARVLGGLEPGVRPGLRGDRRAGARGVPAGEGAEGAGPGAMAAQFALNAIGPALVLKHVWRLMPRDRRRGLAVLSARVGSIGDNRLGGWHGPTGRRRRR